MTPVQRWEESTPEEMLELSLHAERGPMIVDDLRRLPSSPLIVAEGSTVSPAVVSSGVGDPSRAVWLLPTAEFHRAQLDERGLARGPRELYLLLAKTIEESVAEHEAPALAVDASRGIDQMVTAVEKAFAAALAEGPRAETSAERRTLLREGNEAIAAQVRGYYARPWADGDAESILRTFICECGATTCEASVDLAVGELAGGPVLAPGH
jgi:hypothetical protein